MQYDIFGDVHGQVAKLEALLSKMGYFSDDGIWRHSTRKAIFVGDFIDRGATGVETVRIVRGMVEKADALAVMGNHDLNAIAWHAYDYTRNPADHLRTRLGEMGKNNRQQHQQFLDQVEGDPVQHETIVDWFLTLPLWLDLPELRVVHACWHQPFMMWLAPRLKDGRHLTRELMVAATDEPADQSEKDNDSPSVFKAVDTLTKGIEVPLPAGFTFLDKHGHPRDRVRVRWWDEEAATHRQKARLRDEQRATLSDRAIPAHAMLRLTGDKPVFFGHYSLEGASRVESPMAVCVDYTTDKGGPVTAYRWDAGEPLSDDRFLRVD